MKLLASLPSRLLVEKSRTKMMAPIPKGSRLMGRRG